MVTEQTNITKAITQAAAEAARLVVQAMAVARTDNSEKTQNVIPKVVEPITKQPTLNWEAEYKYSKIKIFIQQVNNVFESYSTLQTERIAIVKKWLCREGLQPL